MSVWLSWFWWRFFTPNRNTHLPGKYYRSLDRGLRAKRRERLAAPLDDPRAELLRKVEEARIERKRFEARWFSNLRFAASREWTKWQGGDSG